MRLTIILGSVHAACWLKLATYNRLAGMIVKRLHFQGRERAGNSIIHRQLVVNNF
ncbi:MAG: hypothetical protein WCF57_10510 [Pyrinomonadaceae bacterium]